jgi:flagellar motor switch protein FliN/FliY
MAGDSPTLKQEDIEELLRQAQMASGLAEGPTAAASAAPSIASPEPPRYAAAPVASPTASPSLSTMTRAEAARPAYGQRPTTGSAVGDDVQFLLSQAEEAIASVQQPVAPELGGLTAFELKDLGAAPASGDKATLELLKDVDLNLRIELGRTHMYLEDVLKLKRGSVVTLDKLAGDPVDVFVNGRLVARGEVLVLNDNFCVRVTELLSGDDFE